MWAFLDGDERVVRLAAFPPWSRRLVADALDHRLPVVYEVDRWQPPRLFIAGTEILPPTRTEILPPTDWPGWHVVASSA